MALALAVILCLASGCMLVSLGGPFCSPSYGRLLRASLSVGFGLGIFSVVFFVARLAGFLHLLTIDVLVVALLVGAVLFLRGRSVPPVVDTPAQPGLDLPPWLSRVLTGTFAFALAAALYSAVLRSIAHPHGDGWDAFAIWNLHARFLFRGGEHWRDGFSPLIPWSHPDYPLLLPSAIAHFWTMLGHESTAVPAVIGLAFTFSTLGLLFFALAILRGRTIAMLGGLALASTPFFVDQGSAQYADVPLSFFFLAVMVLFHLGVESRTEQPLRSPEMLVLAGIAAGFAIWTKNEGILFLCATIAAHVLVRAPQRTRCISIFLLGAAPFLLLVGWFKHLVAFPNELFSNQDAVLHKILDPARYWAIFQWFLKDFLRFGEWWLVPGTVLLLAFFFIVRDKRKSQPGYNMRASVLTLTFTLAGYFAIYVITPYDLHWHLRFSLNRLFLQLWPCALFVLFSAAPQQIGDNVQKWHQIRGK